MKRSLTMVALAAAIFASGSALARGKKAAADGNTKLKLNVAPAETEIIIDGQKKGTAEKVKEISLAPGKHELDFKFKGDEHTDEVTLKKGQTTTFEWKFEDDRHPAMAGDGSDGAGDPVPAPTDTSAPAPAGDSK